MHIKLRFDPQECRWVGSIIGCATLPEGCEWPGHDHLRNQPLSALVDKIRQLMPGVEIVVDHASKLHYELWWMQRHIMDWPATP